MLDLATIATVLNQLYANQIADQLNQRTTLLAAIPKSIGETGKNIAWDVKVSRNPAGGSYASGADISFAGTEYDVEKPAVLQWKRIQVPFQVAGDALAVAARAGGPDAYANLFDKQMKDAARNLSIILGNQLYGDGTGNGGLDLDGLKAALASTTGTYAGIDRGTYPVWAANVYANGGVARNLSVDLLLTGETGVFTASGFQPDYIVTTPALHQKYESLFESGTPVGLRQDAASAGYSFGAQQLYFKGIPVIRDARCPAGTLFMLTKDSMSLEMLPSVPVADGSKLNDAEETLMNADGDLGVQVGVELLGKTGDSVKGFVKAYLNVKVAHPNMNAYITDLQ